MSTLGGYILSCFSAAGQFHGSCIPGCHELLFRVIRWACQFYNVLSLSLNCQYFADSFDKCKF